MAHQKETNKGSRHRRTPSGQRWMAQSQGVIQSAVAQELLRAFERLSVMAFLTSNV